MTYRTCRTNAVHRWPYNVQLYFHFVLFCGYVSNNMLFGAKGVIISPAGKRAPYVLWPAASLQPGERLGYRPQQGLRFLRVCWCNNDRSGVKFWSFVTVHHERKVKRETNKMQLIWSLFQLSISTCFGHHYAHLQENKVVYYCIWCSALVVLAVVVCCWDASCVHCVEQQLSHGAHSLRPSSTRPRPAQPVHNTICCNTQSCSPEDGHNDARNKLR